MSLSSGSDAAVGKIILDTIGFDPNSMPVHDMMRLTEQFPLLGEIESHTIRLLVGICSKFFEDAEKIAEYYDDIVTLIHHGSKPDAILRKVHEAMDVNKALKDEFHSAFSKVKDNVVVIRWRSNLLTADLSKKQVIVSALEKEINNITTDTERLVRDNKDMSQRILDLDAMISQITQDHEHILAKRDRDLHALQTSLQHMKEEVRDLQDANTILTTQYTALQKSEEQARNTLSQHIAQLNELNALYQNKCNEVDQLVQDNTRKDHDLQKLKKHVQSCEQNLQSERAKHAQLQQDLNTIAEERNDYLQKLKNLTTTWENMKQANEKQTQDIQALYNDNKVLSSEVKKLKETKKDLQEKLNDYDALVSNDATLKLVQNRLHAVEQELQDCELQVKALQNSKQALENEVQELRKANEGVPGQQQEVTRLKHKLSSVEQELAMLEEQNNTLMEEKTALKANVFELKRANEKHMDTIQDLEAEVTKLTGKIDGYNAKLQEKSTEMDALQHELTMQTQLGDKLRSEIEQLKAQAMVHAGQETSHQDQVRQLQSTIDDLEARIQNDTVTSASLTQELAQVKQDHAKLLEDTKQTVKESEELVSALQEQLEEARTKQTEAEVLAQKAVQDKALAEQLAKQYQEEAEAAKAAAKIDRLNFDELLVSKAQVELELEKATSKNEVLQQLVDNFEQTTGFEARTAQQAVFEKEKQDLLALLADKEKEIEALHAQSRELEKAKLSAEVERDEAVLQKQTSDAAFVSSCEKVSALETQVESLQKQVVDGSVLVQELSEIKAERAQLQATVEDLTEQLSTSVAKEQQLQDTVSTLKQELTNAKTANELLQIKVDAGADLNHHVQSNSNEVATLRGTVVGLEASLHAANQACANLEDLVRDTKQTLSDCKKDHAKVLGELKERHLQELEQATLRAVTAETEKEHVQAKLDNSEAKFATLSQAMKLLANEVHDVEMKLAMKLFDENVLQARVAFETQQAAIAQHKETIARANTLETQLDGIQQDKAMDILRSETVAHDTEKDAAITQANVLRSRVTQVDADIGVLQNALIDKVTLVNDLQAQVSVLQSKLSSIEPIVEDLQSERAKLQDDLSERVLAATQLELDKLNLQSEIDGLQVYVDKCTELTAKLQEKDTVISEISELLEKEIINAQLMTNAAKTEAVQEAQEQLSDMHDQHSLALQSAMDAGQQLRMLTSTLEDLLTERDSLRKQIEDMENSVDREQILTLASTIELKQAEIEALQEQNREELARLQEENRQELERLQTQARTELATKQAEFEAYKTEANAQLQSEKDRLERIIEEKCQALELLKEKLQQEVEQKRALVEHDLQAKLLTAQSLLHDQEQANEEDYNDKLDKLEEIEQDIAQAQEYILAKQRELAESQALAQQQVEETKAKAQEHMDAIQQQVMTDLASKEAALLEAMRIQEAELLRKEAELQAIAEQQEAELRAKQEELVRLQELHELAYMEQQNAIEEAKVRTFQDLRAKEEELQENSIVVNMTKTRLTEAEQELLTKYSTMEEQLEALAIERTRVEELEASLEAMKEQLQEERLAAQLSQAQADERVIELDTLEAQLQDRLADIEAQEQALQATLEQEKMHTDTMLEHISACLQQLGQELNLKMPQVLLDSRDVMYSQICNELLHLDNVMKDTRYASVAGTARISELNDQLKQLHSAAKLANYNAEAYQNLEDAYEETVKELENELQLAHSKLSTQQEYYENIVAQQKVQLDEQKVQLEQALVDTQNLLEARIAELEDTHQDAMLKLEEAHKDALAALEARYEAAVASAEESKNEEILELQEELEQLGIIKDEITQEYHELEQEHVQLEKAKEKLEDTKIELESLVESLQDQTQIYEKDLAHVLQVAEEEKQSNKLKLAQKDEVIEDLRAQLTHTQTELAKEQTQVQELLVSKSELEATLEDMRARLEEAIAEQGKITTMLVDKYSQELQQQEQIHATTLTNFTDTYEERIGGLTQTIEDLECKLGEVELELTVTNSQCCELQDKLLAMEEEYTQYQASVKEAEQKRIEEQQERELLRVLAAAKQEEEAEAERVARIRQEEKELEEEEARKALVLTMQMQLEEMEREKQEMELLSRLSMAQAEELRSKMYEDQLAKAMEEAREQERAELERIKAEQTQAYEEELAHAQSLHESELIALQTTVEQLTKDKEELEDALEQLQGESLAMKTHVEQLMHDVDVLTALKQENACMLEDYSKKVSELQALEEERTAAAAMLTVRVEEEKEHIAEFEALLQGIEEVLCDTLDPDALQHMHEQQHQQDEQNEQNVVPVYPPHHHMHQLIKLAAEELQKGYKCRFDLDKLQNDIEALQLAQEAEKEEIVEYWRSEIMKVHAELDTLKDHVETLEAQLEAKTETIFGCHRDIEMKEDIIESLELQLSDIHKSHEDANSLVEDKTSRVFTFQREIERLQEKLYSVQSDYAKLQAELDETSSLVEQKTKENQVYMDTIAKLEDKMKNMVDTSKDEYTALVDQRDALQVQVEQLQQTNKDLEHDLDAIVEDKTSALFTLQRQNEMIQAQLEAKQAELASVQDKYEELERENTAKMEEVFTVLEEMQEELESAHATIDDLKQEIEDLVEEKEGQETCIKARDIQLQDMQALVDARTQRMQVLEQELKHVQSQAQTYSEDMVQKLETQINDLQAQVHTLQGMCNDKQANIVELHTRLVKYDTYKQTCEHAMSSLPQLLELIQSMQLSEDTLQHELATTKQQINELQAQLSDKDMQVALGQQELAVREQTLQELQQKYVLLQNTHSNLLDEYHIMKTQVDTMEPIVQNSIALESEVEKQTETIADLHEQITRMQKELTDHVCPVVEVNNHNSSNPTKDDAERTNNAKKIAALESRVVVLEQVNDQLVSEIDALEQTKTEVEQQLQQYRDTISLLNKDLQTLTQDKEGLIEEVDSLRLENHALQDAMVSNTYTNTNTNPTNNVEVDELQQQLAHVQSEYDALQKTYNDLATTHEKCSTTQQELQNTIDTLRTLPSNTTTTNTNTSQHQDGDADTSVCYIGCVVDGEDRDLLSIDTVRANIYESALQDALYIANELLLLQPRADHGSTRGSGADSEGTDQDTHSADSEADRTSHQDKKSEYVLGNYLAQNDLGDLVNVIEKLEIETDHEYYHIPQEADEDEDEEKEKDSDSSSSSSSSDTDSVTSASTSEEEEEEEEEGIRDASDVHSTSIIAPSMDALDDQEQEQEQEQEPVFESPMVDSTVASEEEDMNISELMALEPRMDANATTTDTTTTTTPDGLVNEPSVAVDDEQDSVDDTNASASQPTLYEPSVCPSAISHFEFLDDPTIQEVINTALSPQPVQFHTTEDTASAANSVSTFDLLTSPDQQQPEQQQHAASASVNHLNSHREMSEDSEPEPEPCTEDTTTTTTTTTTNDNVSGGVDGQVKEEDALSPVNQKKTHEPNQPNTHTEQNEPPPQQQQQPMDDVQVNVYDTEDTNEVEEAWNLPSAFDTVEEQEQTQDSEMNVATPVHSGVEDDTPEPSHTEQVSASPDVSSRRKKEDLLMSPEYPLDNTPEIPLVEHPSSSSSSVDTAPVAIQPTPTPTPTSTTYTKAPVKPLSDQELLALKPLCHTVDPRTSSLPSPRHKSSRSVLMSSSSSNTNPTTTRAAPQTPERRTSSSMRNSTYTPRTPRGTGTTTSSIHRDREVPSTTPRRRGLTRPEGTASRAASMSPSPRTMSNTTTTRTPRDLSTQRRSRPSHILATPVLGPMNPSIDGTSSNNDTTTDPYSLRNNNTPYGASTSRTRSKSRSRVDELKQQIRTLSDGLMEQVLSITSSATNAHANTTANPALNPYEVHEVLEPADTGRSPAAAARTTAMVMSDRTPGHGKSSTTNTTSPYPDSPESPRDLFVASPLHPQPHLPTHHHHHNNKQQESELLRTVLHSPSYKSSGIHMPVIEPNLTGLRHEYRGVHPAPAANLYPSTSPMKRRPGSGDSTTKVKVLTSTTPARNNINANTNTGTSNYATDSPEPSVYRKLF